MLSLAVYLKETYLLIMYETPRNVDIEELKDLLLQESPENETSIILKQLRQTLSSKYLIDDESELI